jgi:dimethylargininase
MVRRPSPHLASGELTHLRRVPVDAALAAEQWEQYVEAFRSRGWTIVEVDPADDQPDGVFIEDALVAFGGLVVICRAGAESRRGEADTARSAASELGIRIAEIADPGTLDGGDVLKLGRTVYVGASCRTNAAGIAQLRELLEPLGRLVVEVPVTRVLHLKSGLTALPDGTVIGAESLVDDPGCSLTFYRFPKHTDPRSW